MPVFFALTGYLLAALLLAALLYFPIYQVLDMFWEVRPDRVFYRSAMIIAILGFLPLLRRLQLANRAVTGFTLPLGTATRQIGIGLIIGILIMAPLGAALVWSGARAMHPMAEIIGKLPYVLSIGLVSGLLVGLIEESFFRGAMQGGMRRHSGFLSAATLISLFYAALHFVRPPMLPTGHEIGWDSGFLMLGGMLHKYSNFGHYADSFIALFLAGFLLSLVRERQGHLLQIIGIHAGWVFSIRIIKHLTYTPPDAPTAWLIGGYDGITGWLCSAWLLLLIAIYWRWDREKGK